MMKTQVLLDSINGDYFPIEKPNSSFSFKKGFSKEKTFAMSKQKASTFLILCNFLFFDKTIYLFQLQKRAKIISDFTLNFSFGVH
jgi:hypothetical protein